MEGSDAELEEGLDGEGFWGVWGEGMEVLSEAAVGGEEGTAGGGVGLADPDFIFGGVVGKGDGAAVVGGEGRGQFRVSSSGLRQLRRAGTGLP